MCPGSVSRHAAAVVLACGLAGSAVAHHGVTGRYDASRPILISGIVTATTFSPPHPVLSVRVERANVADGSLGRPSEYFGPVSARPEDLGQVREIELSPVRMFYDLEAKVKPGDRITLVALRNCLPPHQLRSTWIRLRDGETLSYSRDWAPGVDGC
ncbi:hypothetical protein AM571_PA00036 (plasmid) [Rhizobium etli 8C-3]|uniref:Uncharacterized protein n=1 Tax=Rhizobium etli 8C-3 TaxID=538025 RepID=A0A1L5P9S9_RHIET|nr:DUF6152 family protein [Rhizobium etli]APO76928.1 hypothetical protein AM571_PA00036 [Rhizobium etli 8C-3]